MIALHPLGGIGEVTPGADLAGMLAASLDRSSAVAALLKRGADPALKDQHGATALQRARKTEDPEIVKLLETR